MPTIDLREIRLPSGLWVGERDVASELLRFIDSTVAAWTAVRQLSPKQGYGLATTDVLPVGALNRVHWNDPRAFLGYGVAAHGASPHYLWNALRKGRMLLRARQAGIPVTSSLELARTHPGFPRDVITESERAGEKDGGLIRWGDFPYGGAVYRTDGVHEVMLSLSIWLQKEDHRVAGTGADRLLELAEA